MDSESGNESEDYSYDESSNEIEYSSDLDEEFTASFEKISTTRRNWRKGNFNPRLFSFDSSSCGLSSTIKNLALETSLDFFELFFDRRLLETIVKETNRFHANSAWTSYSHTAPWIDTTINEMYTFLATVMLMPHSKKIIFVIIGLLIILLQHLYLLNFSLEIDSELYLLICTSIITKIKLIKIVFAKYNQLLMN